MTMHSAETAPLAIIGMACRVPGADDLDQFWHLLRSGGSGIRELPPDRLDRELYYDPAKGKRNKSYSTLGGLVTPRAFDSAACPLPADLMGRADIAHLTLCEVAAAACRQAGLDPFDMPLRNTGVYVGHTAASPLASQVAYAASAAQMAQYLNQVESLGALPSHEREDLVREVVAAVRRERPPRPGETGVDLTSHAAAGLISRGFGLNGPFLVVDAACASSLQALLVGGSALRQGRIDMAIVGGASYCKSDTLVLFSQAQTLSARGSRPFDADADGLILAEGYVVIVVKTLARALADGDPVQAVIRGIGMATDGRGKSLWAPRKEGQILAIRRAYGSHIDPQGLDYIEAHATSTQIGDATELQALDEALRGQLPPGKKIPIGSVKANIGHTLEAAGLSGLVKTVLAMRAGIIPPAINCQRLNPEINWERAPFFVPTSEMPWPAHDGDGPRRAGVNSFGIGGLNVHVVLDQFQESASQPTAARAPNTNSHTTESEAVAIVGAGCILPGARTLEAFWDLLVSGRDAKVALPAGRWNANAGTNPQTGRAFADEPPLGGFITDYAYDWKRHVVPPKQVEQADPLQFMLLDATEEALRDAGYDRKPLDRSRVAVVVGTTFGDEFAQQLNMGLRLPQFQRTLGEALRRRGLDPTTIDQVARRFAEILIKHNPALVDETGSFTSSTLASRITKAFDLQGGALALDAGAASGLASLTAGVDFLLSGACDAVVCAAGERNMGLLSYEAYAAAGKLAAGSARSPFDAHSDGSVPGEGVGVVLLKRLSDARRDGDRIHAVIRGLGAAAGEAIHDTTRLAMRRALRAAQTAADQVVALELTSAANPDEEIKHVAAIAETYGSVTRETPLQLGSLTGQIGHTMAASGMAALIKSSLALEHASLPANVGIQSIAPWLANQSSQLAASPQSMSLKSTSPEGKLMAGVTALVDGRLAYHVLLERGAVVSAGAAPRSAEPAWALAMGQKWRIVRIGAATQNELVAKARAALDGCEAIFAAASASAFERGDLWRLALVVDSPASLLAKLRLAGDQLANPPGRWPLDEQGIFRRTGSTGNPRIAFLFPGQGSQYAGMLADLVREYPPAAMAAREVDAAMALFELPSFAELSADATGALGVDVLRTQIGMLLADVIMFRALSAMDIRPAVISAHSYGEFPALVAAGAWSVEQAIGATRARAKAIESNWSGPESQMVSTTATLEAVQRELRGLADVYLSHHNAPDQTVVAGRATNVRQLAERLRGQGFDIRPLAVPRPFHTPLMAAAQEPFRRALATTWIVPPRIPLVSNVSGQLVEDADQIRGNLVNQLIAPVHYVPLVEQLVCEQPTALVEVGPQQVLTRLNRRIIAGDAAVSIASDVPKRSSLEQLCRVRAQLECAGALDQRESPSTATARAQSGTPSANRQTDFVNFDATQRRKSKLRASSAAPHPAVEPSRALAAALGQNGAAADSAASAPTSHQPAVGQVEGVKSPAPTVQPAPAQSKQQSFPASASSAELETFLINFVVEQTGYPPEIVRLDADLEADLGIDSIKKAQLFGELREYFDIDVTPAANLKLEDFPTLRHVVDFLNSVAGKGEWLTTPAAAAEAVSAVDATPTTASAHRGDSAMSPVAAAYSQPPYASNGTPPVDSKPGRPSTTIRARSNAPPREELEKFLVNFVIEQTGYPPEIVRLDADLEADLGIDSIKKAQLFGELGEFYEVSAPENLRLDDFPTLRHVLALLAQSADDEGSLQPTGEPSTVVADEFPASAPTFSETAVSPRASVDPIYANGGPSVTSHIDFGLAPAVATAVAERGVVTIRARANAPRREELEKFLVNFVIEQTGYPPEIVRLDADLEADLGIDSIKKAQLFGELGEFYDVTAPENLRLDDFPTLRHVLTLLERSTDEQPHDGPAESMAAAPLSPPATANPAPGATDSATAYETSRQWGAHHGEQIRAALKRFAETARPAIADASHLKQLLVNPSLSYSTTDVEQLQGVADGAQVHVGNIIAAHQRFSSGDSAARAHRENITIVLAAALGISAASMAASVIDTSAPDAAAGHGPTVTERLVLRTCSAALAGEVEPAGFVPQGAVFILGDNPVGRALERRLASSTINVLVVPGSDSPEAAREAMAQLWARQPIAHVFLTTPHDSAACEWRGRAAWEARREHGMILPFLVCQDWIARVGEAQMADSATLIAVTALGGDFGLAGNVTSVEGGGLTGLVKSIYIESLYERWKGVRCQTLDFSSGMPADEMAASICRELATREPNLEVGFVDGRRRVLRAVRSQAPAPIASEQPRGTWVVTGGGRGVTALSALALGRRYGLKLHLLGTAPAPDVDPSWRQLTNEGMNQLKNSVMRDAGLRGRAPHEAWTRIEKALQIDKTLRACAAAGVQATYHSCDVSDEGQLSRVLDEIRAADGPIEGVLHGAAVVRDTSFERKKLSNVRLSLAAKADAAAALMELTWQDPLRHFIAFSSGSGRFGFRGQTDYAAANELLSKQIDWYRRQRPECRSAAVHWHAWDEVGVAARPELQATFASMEVKFMPPAEGIEHLVREIEAGLPEPEVLFTDAAYLEKEYPMPVIASAAEVAAIEVEMSSPAAPVVPTANMPLVTRTLKNQRGELLEAEVDFHPVNDPFLAQHRMGGHPLLPVVIAIECLAEAAHLVGGKKVARLEEIAIHNGLSFKDEQPRTLQVAAIAAGSGAYHCRLTSEFRDRDGRLVDPARLHVAAKVTLADSTEAFDVPPPGEPPLGWFPISYPDDAPIFHGQPLRSLKQVACQYDGAYGQIVAPAIDELGGSRAGRGWIVAASVLDACLFACGTFAYSMFGKRVEIPAGIDMLRLLGQSRAGETCVVRMLFRGPEGRGSRYDFNLFGEDGRPLMAVNGYRTTAIVPGNLGM